MASGTEYRPNNVLYVNPASNTDTPQTVIDNAADNTVYLWIKNAVTSYTPISTSDFWCYIIYKCNSSGYCVFLAFNQSTGKFYSFSYRKNAWFEFDPTVSTYLETDVANKVVTGVSVSTALMFKQGYITSVRISGLSKSSNGSGWTDMMDLSSYLNNSAIHYSIMANDDDTSALGHATAEARVNASGMLQIYSPVANRKYWGEIWLIDK